MVWNAISARSGPSQHSHSTLDLIHNAALH
ncbi:hypothetical protein HMPREF1484_00854 [Dermabacter sp. HFH0086]|nr:hypothetical protein HMPREF1484_00854 [Dermabacter sp. HFH0086]